MTGAPILHVIAGPNGAGKTSFYQATLSRMTEAEFVNADRLIAEAIGRHAQTQAEAEQGQALANARRDALLAERVSFVTESTFSHESKLQLIQDALDRGYEVIVYHVSVDSADLAVARVEERYSNGGHPVDPERVRGRYERNRAFIRDAMLMAQMGFVFDNSILGEPARRLMTFTEGRITSVSNHMVAWALEVYDQELQAWRAAG